MTSYWLPRLFPLLLIVLDVGAAFVWLYFANWRMFIYWLAAALLTAVITF